MLGEHVVDVLAAPGGGVGVVDEQRADRRVEVVAVAAAAVPWHNALSAGLTNLDDPWQFAENDVVEMTKRGVPGVWTYGFYDGWVPNYMFFIAHEHNAIGRFYEVQSYGPDNYEVRPGATTTSKEWFRPNPPLPFIKWGPRNNVNIQQSGLLFAMQFVAKNRDMFLENYWLKNKRAVALGFRFTTAKAVNNCAPVGANVVTSNGITNRE